MELWVGQAEYRPRTHDLCNDSADVEERDDRTDGMHKEEQDDEQHHRERKADVADCLHADALVALPTKVVRVISKRPLADDPVVVNDLAERVHCLDLMGSNQAHQSVPL